MHITRQGRRAPHVGRQAGRQHAARPPPGGGADCAQCPRLSKETPPSPALPKIEARKFWAPLFNPATTFRALRRHDHGEQVPR